MPNLCLIADSPDPLSARLESDAIYCGWTVERLTYAEASRRFTIHRDADTHVTPALPIFLRLPHASSPWATDEAQFHRAEMCSLVWAAAALTKSPVVNRPNAFGFSGRYSISTNVVRDRAGLGVSGPEAFGSAPPEPQAPEADWWLEQQKDRVAFAWSDRETARGPFRAGAVRAGFELRSVTVVGHHAFCDDSSKLGASSIKICSALGITFASVSWRWYATEQVAEFVRVNPHPQLPEIGVSWTAVADRILAELSS